jgi:hypothetical protein
MFINEDEIYTYDPLRKTSLENRCYEIWGLGRKW